MKDSKIAWTDHTFNPWWGCEKESPACKNCYAEAFARRLGKSLWGPTADRPFASDSYWKQPLKWNDEAAKSGRRAKVFSASMSDVFEDRAELAEERVRLFRIIEATPHLDWLLLTKRAAHMRRLAVEAGWPGHWPENVWAGVTVESQRYAHERIPHLLQVPARIRFLSCEPLLEAVDLSDWLPLIYCCSCGESFGRIEEKDHDVCPKCGRRGCLSDYGSRESLDRFLQGELSQEESSALSWVICGGESGPGARPFNLAWARSLRYQCNAARVPFFMKQMGANPIDTGILDIVGPDDKVRYRRPAGHPDIEEALRSGGYSVRPGRPRYKDKAGDDPSEWPEPMRVQEFPR